MQQALGDHRGEGSGKLGADLVARRSREGVDDAVDGPRGPGGVQGAEHEVARLGGGDGRLDGLEIAHFPDQDDVGVLAQRGTDSFREGGQVLADLALRDQALLVRVRVFDGILDRDDVTLLVLVDPVDQGSERRGLAGAGRAGDEDEAAGALEQVLDHERQAQLLEREHGRRQQTEDHAVTALAAEGVGAEARAVAESEGEVAAAVGVERGAAGGRHSGEDQGFGLGGGEGRSFDRDELAVDAEAGGTADADVQVRGPVLEHGLQQLVHRVGHRVRSRRRRRWRRALLRWWSCPRRPCAGRPRAWCACRLRGPCGGVRRDWNRRRSSPGSPR